LEHIIDKSDKILLDVFNTCNLPTPQNLTAVTSIISPNSSRWEEYADTDWFEQLEFRCEKVLSALSDE
jgi:hypothetical protein